jgi:hypothetical protein
MEGGGVKRVATAMTTLWRRDFDIRDALMRSGGWFWMLVALLVPFGWVALLFRLEPVRVRVSLLRDYFR